MKCRIQKPGVCDAQLAHANKFANDTWVEHVHVFYTCGAINVHVDNCVTVCLVKHELAISQANRCATCVPDFKRGWGYRRVGRHDSDCSSKMLDDAELVAQPNGKV